MSRLHTSTVMTRTSERSIITRTEWRKSCQRRRRNNRAEEGFAISQLNNLGHFFPGQLQEHLLKRAAVLGLLAQVFQGAAADQAAEGDHADAIRQFLGDVQG